MKKLFLLFAFLPVFAFAQKYSEVVEIPGKTAGQLYNVAREWFAESFISTDNALLMDDRIAGIIIAKGSIPILDAKGKLGWYADFTIKVSFKEGKYRSEIFDISVTTGDQEDSTVATTAFNVFLDKKEYYKKAADSKGLIDNPSGNFKIETATAKETARSNQATYDLISKTESGMNDLLSKIQQKMKEPEANW